MAPLWLAGAWTGMKTVLLLLSLGVSLTRCQDIFLSYVIAEEQPKGTYVGNVAQDSNIRDHVGSTREFQDLTYSFLAEETRVTANFRIDNVSGVLSTAARLDREQLCRFQMECRLSFRLAAQSSLGLFFKIIDVTVAVSDINDNAPTFIPSVVTLTIMENADIGDFYTLPNAIDADTGVNNSVQEYSLLTNDVPFSLQVQGSTSMDLALALSVIEKLDRETVDFYRLTVLAKDAGNPIRSGTLTVSVEVGDVNDHAPVWEFPLYVVNVSEIVPVNTVIVTLIAHDADSGPNGLVIYRFPPLQPDTALGLFALNETSGELSVARPLDEYAGQTYNLEVEARDGGTAFKSARAQVVVRVLDTHNSRPEIIMSVLGSGTTAALSELADLGRVVAHILVRDPDSGLNGIVTCFLNASHFQLQAMDVGQYKVILSRPLDREMQATHVVNVTCEDAGKPTLSDSKIFTVKVRDENDQAPVFTQSLYTARVTETGAYSIDRNVYITTVTATDADVGENALLSYRILGDVQNEFYVFDNGTVVATRGLDRESGGSQRYLSVIAYDHGTMSNTGTATILLTVLDVNDNAPVFGDIAPVFYVSEGVPLTSNVGNVTATDADEEENAIVLYSLHPAYEGQVPFKVITDGVIKTNGTLDREKRDRYDFEIVAHDLGRPHLSSSVVVTVRILDINDNSPIFLFPNDINNTVRVPHTLSPNTKVATIVAHDADLGNNERLVFARDGRNGTKFFDVDPETGEVILVRPLSEKDVGEHWLVVVAHDQGFPTQLANQTMLYIQVYRGNHTAAVTSDSAAFRNTLLVIIIVVVTFVLSIVVIVTMVLIRHQDRQRRLYRAKDEEVKVEAHLRKLASPYSGAQEFDASTTGSDASCSSSDQRGRKEVSFSLDEDNNITPGANTPVTYDKEAGSRLETLPEVMKGQVVLGTNTVSKNGHKQDDPRKVVRGLRHKDVGRLTSSVKSYYHHPPLHDGSQKSLLDAQGQDDNISDLSCDASTSDSGRGGSDVEMHGAVSKDSGDNSFGSQRVASSALSGHDHRKHPSQQRTVHFDLYPASFGHARGSGRLTTFPNSASNDSLDSRHSMPSFTSFSPASRFAGSPVQPSSSPASSQTTTLTSSFARSRNGPSGHRPSHGHGYSNPNRNSRDLHGPLPRQSSASSSQFPEGEEGSYIDLQNQTHPQHHRRLVAEAGDYMDMKGAPYSSSLYSVGPAATWDGDTTSAATTTTSGSYTVDPQQLAQEIDKLFFDQPNDVVV